MRQFLDFIARLFYYSDFQSLWLVKGWSPLHAGVHILGNLLLITACMALPLLLYRYMQDRKEGISLEPFYPFLKTFLIAVAIAWGVDVICDIFPLQRINSVVRLATGGVCWAMLYRINAALTGWLYKMQSIEVGQQDELLAEIYRREKVEQQLKEKNEQLLEAERTACLGYGHWNMMSKEIFLSEMAYSLLGIYNGEKLTEEKILAQIHPADMRFVKDSVDKNLKGKIFREFYFRVITVQMVMKHVLVKGQVIRDGNGQPVMIKGTIQDVSELRHHMLKIEQQNRRLRKIAWVQSHRMRSPVATILGMADLFNNQQLEDPMNAEIVKNIRDLTHKLDNMIHEVDALTRVPEQEEAE